MAKQFFAAIIIDQILEEEEHEENIRKSKKRTSWVKEWRKERPIYTHTRLVKKLELTCAEDFKNYLRMDAVAYEELLAKVTPSIQRQNTNMRDAISANERLSATLRYLATGQTFSAMNFDTYIGTSTLSGLIIETCDVIIKVLKKFIDLPKKEEDWLRIAEEFHRMWNFRNCIGSIDGKHINLIKPPGSGAYYFNYKKTYSIVLMALVNAKYEFTMVEAGANGRVSDGGVFSATKFFQLYEQGQINIPKPTRVPGFDKELPYVFVADDAFAMRENFLKPYSRSGLTKEEEHFNYRLSRARNIVENTFGIISSRFRVLLSTSLLSPEKTTKVVLAICYLHNYLKKRSPTSYLRSTDIETHSINSTISTHPNSSKQNNSSFISKETRNNFKDYFNRVDKFPVNEH